jgi:predicted ATPase
MLPHVYSVQIRNYKSMADVDVGLGPLTILVGPNGSGKSNFVDALAFVRQCLVDSIELAFKSRGGIGAVRRQSGSHPTHIGIRLGIRLDDNRLAEYAFEIAANSTERFRVARERCLVSSFLGVEHRFEIRDGVFNRPIAGIRSQVAPDRLALYAASATEEFRPVYDFLTAMRTYSVHPQRLRELQEPDPGDFLKPDGSNAAAVLKRISEQRPKHDYDRLCRLLGRVVAGIEGIEHHALGQMETLRFRQDIGLKDPWRFDALNMSDGTLRVLGLLLAVYQPGAISVLGIEEPEATVHPAVAELIIEVLMDAARERQVLLTTHSPELLDFKALDERQIRSVIMEEGKTLIAPVDGYSRDAIRERLYTPGELLRNGELSGDFEAARAAADNLRLFGQPLEPPVHEDHGEGDRPDR